MIAKGIVSLLGTLSIITTDPVAAQAPPVVLEAHFVYAIPRGSFAQGGESARPEAGPGGAIGARVQPFSFLGVFGTYQLVRFDCPTCRITELDDRMTTRGVELGIDLRPMRIGTTFAPWLRAAAVYQSLTLTDPSGKASSKPALGSSLAGGLAVSLGQRWELMGGVKLLDVPAEFHFTASPSRSLDVSSVGLMIMGGARLGGRE
jgi:hypothetical protein